MIPIRAGERRLLQETQEASMQDTAVHMQRGTSRDSATNEELTSYSDSAAGPYKGALRWGSGDDRKVTMTGAGSGAVEAQAVQAEASFRLARGHEGVFETDDRIRVTRRYGIELLQPLTFDIIGKPQVTASATVLLLRSVET